METSTDLADFYATRGGAFDKVARERAYWEVVWALRRELLEGVAGAPGRMLDVGGGGGFFLAHCRSHGWEVEGVEPSPTAVEYARREHGVAMHHGPFETFEPAAPFDAVHCALVLEHIAEAEPFLRRLASVVRPGGAVFVEVPNEENALQHAILADTPAVGRWWVTDTHHGYYDFDSLSAALASVGLEEVDRLATFPMELFQLMGLRYVGDREVGARVHGMRMDFERKVPRDVLARVYRALASAGIGRTACILAARRPGPVRE